MSQYFPKPYERSIRNVKFEFDLSNYATKTDLKGATDVYISNVEAKLDFVA